MTTLNEAAQHVEQAAQLEDAKLAALRGDQQRIGADIEQTSRRLSDLNTLLAEKGREVAKQEAVAKKAAELEAAMGKLGITADPIPPAPAQSLADYKPSAIEAGARAAVPSGDQKLVGSQVTA